MPREWSDLGDRKGQEKNTGGFDLKKLDGALKPVFETHVRRQTIAIQYKRSQLEIALDRGRIETSRRHMPIHEIEVELKRGKATDVIAIGREIAEELNAAYGVTSKAERGYALCENTERRAVFAEPIVLLREMTATDAFQIIAMSCVRHFAGNRQAVIAGHAEAIHQMRVGLRRLRAAISIFGAMFRGAEAQAIKANLKWLTDEMGPARDMEVFADEAVAPLVDTTPAPKAVAALKDDVLMRRDRGLAEAREAVRSDRYRCLVLNTVFWINGGRWITSNSPATAHRRMLPASWLARQELDSRAKKVRKKLAKIDNLSAFECHKLRIAVKKLRYAMEFFRSLFSDEKKAINKFSAVLKDLQSLLGQLNDIRVHHELAKEYAAPERSSRRAVLRAFAMGELSGEEHAKTQTLIKAIKRIGRHLERRSLFRP